MERPEDDLTPIRPDDRTPAPIARAQLRADEWLRTLDRRRAVALVVLLVAALTIAVAGFQLVLRLVDGLDILAYTGLFLTNWVANGGLVVPVPGLRLVGWLMIVQQGAALDPTVAGIVGGLAMGLGQASLYVAAETAARSAQHRSGHDADEPSRPPSRLSRVVSGERAMRIRTRLGWLVREHGFVTILGLSLVPNPLTTVAVGMAGAMGMGFRVFLAATFLGRLGLGLALAYLGQGLIDLLSGRGI